MPPARRIERRVLAFQWSALAFIVFATAIALWTLLQARDASQVSLPNHLPAVSQSVLPHAVSDLTIGLSLLALGIIVAAQLILLGFTQLGRHHAVIPMVIEIALWIGFCLACYEMQRGYRAAVACAGPPTHCSVMYPSMIPALLVGLVIGALIGGAWRLVGRFDQRDPLTGREAAAAPIVVEPR